MHPQRHGQHRERVARRLEKSAVREAPETASGERRAAESTAVTRIASSDVEEIKRRAREAWLQLRSRERQIGSAQSFDTSQTGEREAREHDAAQNRSPQDDLAL